MDKQELKELICEVKNSDIPETSKEEIIKLLHIRFEENEAERCKRNSWIPCSEQLPKEGELYNVTIYDGEDYRTEPAYYARIGYLGQGNITPKWWTDCTSNAELIEDGEDKVIAWQPLPEPYKESD